MNIILRNMDYMKRVFCQSIWLLLLAYSAAVSANKVCLYCSSAISSAACKTTTVCGPHEICYSDAYVTPNGDLFFNFGCRDSLQCSSITRRDLAISAEERSTDTTEICSECCRDNLCNSHLCGETGSLPAANRGPICFTCSQQQNSGSCNIISQCSRDEVCALVPAVGLTPMYTRCMARQECYNKHTGALQIFGRRRSNGDCHVLECCEQDVCNNYCNEYTRPTTTTTKATTTTRPTTTAAPTTRPTTTTSTTRKPTTIKATTARPCDSGWYPHGSSCYFISDKNYVFETAQNTCTSMGGYLTEINDEQENNFIANLMTQTLNNLYDYAWIGLKYVYNNSSGRYMWTWMHSGSSLTYNNIGSSYTNTGCGTLQWSYSVWRIVYCTTTGARCICEKAR